MKNLFFYSLRQSWIASCPSAIKWENYRIHFVFQLEIERKMYDIILRTRRMNHLQFDWFVTLYRVRRYIDVTDKNQLIPRLGAQIKDSTKALQPFIAHPVRQFFSLFFFVVLVPSKWVNSYSLFPLRRLYARKTNVKTAWPDFHHLHSPLTTTVYRVCVPSLPVSMSNTARPKQLEWCNETFGTQPK